MTTRVTGFHGTCLPQWLAVPGGDVTADTTIHWIGAQGEGMIIDGLLDACQFVLEDQGEPQSSYWLASQIVEMKLWRASEAEVQDALNKDIQRLGEHSRFVRLSDDEFALRSWTTR